jgi:hypothetical protein
MFRSHSYMPGEIQVRNSGTRRSKSDEYTSSSYLCFMLLQDIPVYAY